MTFEEAVMKHLRRTRPDLWKGYEDVEYVDIRHTEGYQSDMTFWPAEVIIVINRVKRGKNDQRVSQKNEVYVGDDPVAYMRELFEETE